MQLLILIDCMQQLQPRQNVLGFENALSAIQMIKGKSQCQSQNLLNFRRTV